MSIELKEGINNLEVVGTLKEKSLEHILDKNNIDVIRGYLIVEWKRGDRLQNTRVNVYSPQYSRAGNEMKSYNSLSIVESDYKTKENDGDLADRIQISGNVQWNPYMNRDGEIQQTLHLNGSFFHRIGKDDTSIQDHAIASLTLTIGGYQAIQKDGVDTGDKRVAALNIGYRERVNVIPKLVITQEAFGDEVEDFSELFSKGTTGVFTVMFNNYATIKETKEEAHGFGHQEQMATATSYVNNAEIIYSDGVVLDPETRGLTEDQYKHAIELRDQTLAALKNDNGNPIQHPASPARGFGKQEASAPKAESVKPAVADITDYIPNF